MSCPYDETNFLSKLLYTWFDPIVQIARKSKLTENHIFCRPKEEGSQNATQSLEKCWNKEKCRRSPSLQRVIYKAFLFDIFISAVLVFVDVTMSTTCPILLQQILIRFDALNIEEERWKSVIFSILYIASITVGFIARNYALWYTRRVGVRIRVGLSGMIFKKILNFNQKCLARTSTGEIINLLSMDVQKFEQTFLFFHYGWICIIQLIIVLWLMCRITLVPSICAVSIIIVCIPIQSVLNYLYSRIKLQAAKITDERIRIISDMIVGIRIIKVHTWENIFGKMVNQIRRKETSLFLLGYLYQCFQVSQLIYQIKLSMMVLILAMVWQHSGPGYPIALKSYCLFTLINYIGSIFITMNIHVPCFVFNFFETRVSCSRITAFLQLPESDIQFTPTLLDSKEPLLEMSKVFARWKDEVEVPILNSINLRLTGPMMIAIVGSIGSGKSSLLQAIIGELPFFKGSISRSSDIFYLPQTPWILPGTIRENILRGLPYEKKRYESVLRATTLDADIAHLPRGDQTQVGERGVSLSGGQKARLALACLAYSEIQFVLLDDPLAAVDARVAKHLFEECICGFLSDRLRVLVTHQIHFLCKVDKILVLEEGTISHVGTYEELVQKGVDFGQLDLPKSDEYFDDEEFSSLVQNIDIPVEMAYENDAGKMKSLEVFNKKQTISKNRIKFRSEDKVPDVTESTEDIKLFSESLTEAKRASVEPFLSSEQKFSQRRRKSPIFNSEFSSKISQQLPERETKSPSYSTTSVKIDSETSEKEEIAKEQRDDVEIMSYGSVKWRHYFILGRLGGGICGLLFICFLFLLVTANYVLCDFWLAKWSYVVDSYNSTNQTAVSSEKYSHFESPDSGNNLLYLYVYCGLTVGLVLLASLRSMAYFVMMIASAKCIHNKMLEACLHTRIKFFETNTSGRILNRFSKDIGQIDDMLPRTIHDFSQCFLVVLAFGVSTVFISYWLIIPLVPVIISFYFIQKYYLLTSRSIRRMEAIARSPYFSWINITLQGLPCVRATQSESVQLAQYDKVLDAHTSVYFLNIAAGCWVAVRLDLVCTIYITAVVVICFLIGIFGNISSSEVGFLITYSSFLIGSLQWALKQGIEVENQMVSVERAVEYMELKPELTEPPVFSPPHNWPNQGHIKFENFALRYNETSNWALDHITLDIEPASKVGIVGRTGAGKSSLISAIFRLVEGEYGRILIDGIDLKHLHLKSLRKRISIIPQDPVMFAGTIRMNLDLDNKHTDEAIWATLVLVQLEKVISKLEGGLLALISEGGSNFSTGQRQLLALARAILSGNQILVVDEATANVDPGTDSLIQQTLRNQFRNRTVLTVAHRLQTVIDNDIIIVMDSGKVVEIGAPHQLLNPEMAEKDRHIPNRSIEVWRNMDEGEWIKGNGFFANLVRQTGSKESLKLAQIARKAFFANLEKCDSFHFNQK